jgi:hypothetical protein
MNDKSGNCLELKYVHQKDEGLEAWIRKAESDWIRLDFMLEFYMFGNVDLSSCYKLQLRDETIAKKYYDLLYRKFSDNTSEGTNFDFQKYLAWQRNDHSAISAAVKLMNS